MLLQRQSIEQQLAVARAALQRPASWLVLGLCICNPQPGPAENYNHKEAAQEALTGRQSMTISGSHRRDASGINTDRLAGEVGCTYRLTSSRSWSSSSLSKSSSDRSSSRRLLIGSLTAQALAKIAQPSRVLDRKVPLTCCNSKFWTSLLYGSTNNLQSHSLPGSHPRRRRCRRRRFRCLSL